MIKLFEIVDAFDCQSDEMQAFVNSKTGEVKMFLWDELSAVEDDEDCSGYDIDPDEIEEIKEILFSDKYLRLPDKYDIHEYQIMEKFCNKLENEEMRETALILIRGGGAFQRIRDFIHLKNIEKQWYAYRYAHLKEIAIRWCKDKKICCRDEKRVSLDPISE